MSGRCCAAALTLIETPVFRAAYSRAAAAAFLPGDLDRVVLDLRDLITEAVTARIPVEALARCVAGRAASWLADRRGATYAWNYAEVDQYAAALTHLLPGDGVFTPPNDTDQQSYAARSLPLHQRKLDPFPHCSDICRDGTCLYRGAVLDVMTSAPHPEDWLQAGDDPDQRWSIADSAGAVLAGDDSGELIRTNRRSGCIRAALCFAQHANRTLSNRAPSTGRAQIAQLIGIYGLDVTDDVLRSTYE